MNPNVTTDPISIDGYTSSDLSGYYSGTYILYKDGDTFLPAYVRGVEGDTDDFRFYVDVLEDGDYRMKEVEDFAVESTLYRCIIPTGWYLQPRLLPFRYDYTVNRSYKKGLCHSFMRFERLDGSGVDFSLKTMRDMIYPRDHFSDDKFLISRRLLVHQGMVYTTYRGLSVGSYSNGKVETPFRCIQQRMEEAQ
jgi:hypothetical protein